MLRFVLSLSALFFFHAPVLLGSDPLGDDLKAMETAAQEENRLLQVQMHQVFDADANTTAAQKTVLAAQLLKEEKSALFFLSELATYLSRSINVQGDLCQASDPQYRPERHTTAEKLMSAISGVLFNHLAELTPATLEALAKVSAQALYEFQLREAHKEVPESNQWHRNLALSLIYFAQSIELYAQDSKLKAATFKNWPVSFSAQIELSRVSLLEKDFKRYWEIKDHSFADFDGDSAHYYLGLIRSRMQYLFAPPVETAWSRALGKVIVRTQKNKGK